VGKGKGGGDISITGDAGKPVTVDLAADLTTVIGGGDKPLAMDTTIGGGERPLATDMTLHTPDTLRSDSTSTMTTTSTLNSTSDMAITQPIVTDSDMRVDVKPLVVDMCFTANIGKIPRLCIKRPYDHHLSLRVMGMELIGLDLHGQRSMIIDDLPKRPDVVWGSDHGGDIGAGDHTRHTHDHEYRHAGPGGPHPTHGWSSNASGGASVPGSTGLRITLGP
jgi:hypothetical protein